MILHLRQRVVKRAMMEMELTGFRYKGFHVWQIQTEALPEAIRGTLSS
jgi:hypothetical protein